VVVSKKKKERKEQVPDHHRLTFLYARPILLIEAYSHVNLPHVITPPAAQRGVAIGSGSDERFRRSSSGRR
jgi:hypothetical protein